NEVHLSPGRLELDARLTVAVESGAVGVIDLRLSAPLPPGATPLKWDAPAGGPQPRSAERLLVPPAALAASSPLGAAAFRAPPDGGERCRLPLSRPRRPHQSLTLRARQVLRWPPGGAAGAAAPRPVPLVTFAGAGRAEGEVRLYLPHADLPAGALRT